MTWQQWVILGAAILIELGRAMMHESVGGWGDIFTPAIVGGASLSLGMQIMGIYSRPKDRGDV